MQTNVVLLGAQTQTVGGKKSLEAQFGSTVMIILFAFSKVLFFDDGHSSEKVQET